MPQVDSHNRVQRFQAVSAAIWAAATFVVWCLSWRWSPADSSDEAALTIMATAAQTVGVALRFLPAWLDLRRQRISSAAGEGETVDSQAGVEREVVWLGAWAAQINALGAVSMISPSFASVLPALIVSAIVETLLLDRAPADWAQRCQQWLFRQLPPLTAPSALDLSAGNFAGNSGGNFAGGCRTGDIGDEVEGEGFFESGPASSVEYLRSTQEGRLDSGERFLSGWVRFELESGQKSAFVTIGFSPAFLTIPEIELDEQFDDAGGEDADRLALSACEMHVDHVTPAGMRIAIKRSDARAAHRGKLLWHAASGHAAEEYSRVQLGSRLP